MAVTSHWKLLAFVAAWAGAPLFAAAQPAAKVPRVAIVQLAAPLADMQGAKPADELTAGFVERLRELGYAEGRTILIERRSAEGQLQRLPALMKELVDLRVDVIVTGGPGAQAARGATSTIPIVAAVGDPISAGLTASLGRPTRNVTGLAATSMLALIGKSLQLLKQAAPSSQRVAMLDSKYVDANATPGAHERRLAAEAGARDVGLTIVPAGIDNADDLERALAVFDRERVDALMVIDTPITYLQRRRIIDFAAQRRLPSMFECSKCVEEGGLMSYGDSGPSAPRLAEYVDRILKGAKPADLPFEEPTKFELVINLKTAASLGLTIPKSLLVVAEVVK